MFNVNPKNLMAVKVATIDVGMAMAVMMVEGILARNKNMARIASAPAGGRAEIPLPCEWDTPQISAARHWRTDSLGLADWSGRTRCLSPPENPFSALMGFFRGLQFRCGRWPRLTAARRMQ